MLVLFLRGPLRKDFGKKYGRGEHDTDALDRALGTGKYQGFGSEVSGDERHEIEELLVGKPVNDRDRLNLARVKHRHQAGEGTGVLSGMLLSGSDEKLNLDKQYKKLERLVADAGGPEKAFDEHGNFRGDREAFQDQTAIVGAAAQTYKSSVDALTDLFTGIIMVVGAVVGAVLTIVTGGLAGPIVAALITGALTIGVKRGMKGARYGWEEMAVDVAMVGVDMLTAGIGASSKFAIKGLQMSAALGKSALRGVVTGGISSAARTAMTDGTWDKGLGEGFGTVFGAAAKGAAVGAATAVASTAFDKSGAGQKLTESTKYGQRALGEAVSSALGGMAGTATELLADTASGKFKGGFWEAAGEVVKAGAREFVSGALEGPARAHIDRTQGGGGSSSASKKRPSDDILAHRGKPQDRLEALQRARAENPDIDTRTFLRQYDADVKARIDAQDMERSMMRELRREMLAGIPAARRGEFADTPIRVIPPADFIRITGSEKGRAVTVIIDGKPHIVMRADADPKVLREEGIHALQSKDPGWKKKVAQLDESKLKDWDKLSLDEQLSLYRTKVEVEIDAQKRLAEGLRGELKRARAPEVVEDLRQRIADAEASLAALTNRLSDVEGLPPDRVDAMRRGEAPKPQYLEQAARLFSKVETRPARAKRDDERDERFLDDIDEAQPTGPRLRRDSTANAGLPRAAVPMEASTFKKRYPDLELRRVGQPWSEVKDGEPRLYRLVEVIGKDGRVVDVREEILQQGPERRWQQRGAESGRRGGDLEAASRAWNRDRAGTETDGTEVIPISALKDLAGGELTGQHGGGHGFDDVIFRFRPDGTARIVLVETKDYSGALSFEDFTAVAGNLKQNLDKLRKAVIGAKVKPDGDPDPTGITASQQKALLDAIRNWDVSLEVHLGARSTLGVSANARVLPSIQDAARARRSLEVALGKLPTDQRRLAERQIGMLERALTPPRNEAERRALERRTGRGWAENARHAIKRAQGWADRRVDAQDLDFRLDIDRVERVPQAFVDEANVGVASRDQLGERPVADVLGAARDAGLAGPRQTILDGKRPRWDESRVVREEPGGEVIIVTSPSGGRSRGSRSVVDRLNEQLLRPVSVPEHGVVDVRRVVWDATPMNPRTLGLALRKLAGQVADHPDAMGRLRVVVPAEGTDITALRGLAGDPHTLRVERVGDHYVLRFDSMAPRALLSAPADPVALAQESSRRRDAAVAESIHTKTPPLPTDTEGNRPVVHHEHVFDHVTIGAGFAGVANEMTRPTRGANDLVIGGANPWDAATSRLGQGAKGEVGLPGAPEGLRVDDAAADPEARFMASLEHAQHVAQNRDAAGIAVYDARVEGRLEPRGPGSDWPGWAEGANLRFPVRGPDGQTRYIYAKGADLAAGPGPARDLPETVLAQAVREQMIAEGAFFYGDQGFDARSIRPGADVANYGAGASGAWGTEAAFRNARWVEWIGRASTRGMPDDVRASHDRLREGEALSPEALKRLAKWTFEEAERNGFLARNREPGGAFDPARQIIDSPTAERKISQRPVVDMARIDYVEDPARPGRKRVLLTTASGERIWKDQLILSIGQDPSAPGGPAWLLRGYAGELEPIYGKPDADGFTPIVGVQSRDGAIRVLGVAATSGDVARLLAFDAVGPRGVRPDVVADRSTVADVTDAARDGDLVGQTARDSTTGADRGTQVAVTGDLVRENLAAQAATLPADSTGVVGGFAHARVTIAAANEALAERVTQSADGQRRALEADQNNSGGG